MNEEAKYHWAEGMKYALECIKTLLILNGGAAVSILTFIGNMKITSTYIIFSMISFALGALMSALAFSFSYVAQLKYGNAHNSEQINDGYKNAACWHKATYGVVIIGIVGFVVGIGLAAYGLWPY